MIIFLNLISIVFLIIVIMCMWKTGEFFNTLTDMHKYRGVLAWDLLVLFFVAIALIMKIIM